MARLTPADRFAAKVDRNGPVSLYRGAPGRCHLWTGAPAGRPDLGQFGEDYGTFWDGTRMVRAHRFAYEQEHGPIPDRLVVDHRCRRRSCVNPAHLEAVDNRTNVLRGAGPTAANARATHCIHGHTLADAYRTRRGHRKCRTCALARAAGRPLDTPAHPTTNRKAA